ncbi:MAG: peptidoglycan-associated lipoprotein Pal [Gammaproteobacteria bacterium]
MKFWIKITLAIVPALFLIACGTSGEVKDDGAAGSGAGAGASATTSGVEGVADGQRDGTPGFEGDPLDDPNAFVSKRVVYFDFDRSDIRDDFRAIVAAHGKYLASHADAKVTLEGHADERGTREYNIALGERRIVAVQRILTLQGASSAQINSISYGEERPAALGHDEDAWGLNRRAEFIYQR